jgi:hypothetical protein
VSPLTLPKRIHEHIEEEIAHALPQRRYPSSPSGSRTNCGGIGNSKMRS